eukprot:gnl/MRDRNA2_/MRDRNA2_34002_c0_seq1.p1 gnl/MRDRNA2_/MRDRNA2_34002_c0~~gnl/MRDRNA2_/MRDRNA2_34002_c0_seq1.p1  ORF type:complete len:308 (+),score=64.17 gnl/MRDRNA2_/MRDRNA2_34002_c0_seq1:93-926(+)
MAEEVGVIFQCALCGSYSFWIVDAIAPHEIELHAGLKAKKAIQRDLHKAEAELLEQRVQKRFECAESGNRFTLMPCPTCVELLTGTLYEAWVCDRNTLQGKCVLCPLLAVTFEADELPPTYMKKGGDWSLAQGVGPKILEVKTPNRLPAAQFRVLLPSRANPIRPQCWSEAKESKTPAKGPPKDDEDSQEVWDQRKALIEAVSEALEDSESQCISQNVDQLCIAVAEAWESLGNAKAKGRSRGGSGKNGDNGARYIKVPALLLPDEARPIVDAWFYS